MAQWLKCPRIFNQRYPLALLGQFRGQKIQMDPLASTIPFKFIRGLSSDHATAVIYIKNVCGNMAQWLKCPPNF